MFKSVLYKVNGRVRVYKKHDYKTFAGRLVKYDSRMFMFRRKYD